MNLKHNASLLLCHALVNSVQWREIYSLNSTSVVFYKKELCLLFGYFQCNCLFYFKVSRFLFDTSRFYLTET